MPCNCKNSKTDLYSKACKKIFGYLESGAAIVSS